MKFVARQESGTPSPIMATFLSGDHDVLISTLRSIKGSASTEGNLIKDVGSILVSTTSQHVRDAAALVLADLRATDAITEIVSVLERADIAKGAATLLYALDQLGASIPLSVLFGHVEHGSYETRAESLLFIEDGKFQPFENAEDERTATDKLVLLVGSMDEEGAKAAALALEAVGQHQSPRVQ